MELAQTAAPISFEMKPAWQAMVPLPNRGSEGARLREAAGGYHLCLMTGSERLAHELEGLARGTLTNGAMTCTLLTGELG